MLFEEALAELSGVPIDRVTNFIHDRSISGFRALYRKAGLPDSAYPAFREAISAMREGVLFGGQGGAARLNRGLVERVLEACAAEHDPDLAALVALLRRFAVEAAREEARMFCDDLVANDHPIMAAELIIDDTRLVAVERAAQPGTIDGPIICSRTSGRPRFSWTRNSSVTARNRLVSTAANSLASEREYSR